jgi:hypothetical protein
MEPLLLTVSEVMVAMDGLVKEYGKLSPEEQKAVRHQVYQRHGDYGKALFSLVKVFEETDRRLRSE